MESTSTLQQVLAGLRQTIGLVLPPDTDEHNFIDRLDAALMTYQGAKRFLKPPPRGKEHRVLFSTPAPRSLFAKLPSDADSIVGRMCDTDLESIIKRHHGHN